MRYWNHKKWRTETSRLTSVSASKLTADAVFREIKPPRMAGKNGSADQSDGELMIAQPVTKSKRPSFYKVVLLNDDYTPMDFVVTVIEQIFRKTHEEAVNIMLDIHQKGAAAVGCFTRDVAETKVDQVIEYARLNDYPLQCVIERE